MQVLDRLHTDQSQLLPFDEKAASIRNLAGYASKALPKSENEPIDAELIRVYPNTNYSGRPYEASRNYRTERKNLKKLRNAAARDCREPNVEVIHVGRGCRPEPGEVVITQVGGRRNGY